MAKKRKDETKKTKVSRLDHELAIDTFIQAILDGGRQTDAYKLAHPKCQTTNLNSLRVRACQFAKRPEVQEALQVARRELAERHSNFRDHLVEMLTEEIDTCYKDNRTLSPVMKQVEVACRVLGMDKQTVELKGDTGAFDRDSVAANLNFLIVQHKGDK